MQISINAAGLTAKPPKEFDWSTYNSGFKAVDITAFELLENVGRGNSFCPVFNGTRKAANFTLAQHIALDFDHGNHDLAYLLAQPFIRAYACVIYPSLSSVEGGRRHRVVFQLDAPITTAEGYMVALETVHDLFPDADQACVDVSRQFYGNGTIHRDSRWEECYYDESVLPLSDLRVYAKGLMQRKRREQPAPIKRTQEGTPAHRIVTLDDVFDRLGGIDPYVMSHNEWVSLGCALHREFGEGAFFPFKSWSDRPGHDPLTFARWKSMGGDSPKPATMGTIVALILKYGRAA